MFSVIIPAYNAADYIQNAIASVLAQTVADFEILVVDDGSQDDTRRKVEAFDDLRIRYIYQENGGVSAARNTGIRNAGGEYICFLDADDLWKPHHLEVISRMIQKYPAASVYLTGHEIRLHNGQNMEKHFRIEGDRQSDNMFREIWMQGYQINTNSMACKAGVFAEVGLFETGVKNGEDDDMWYRLFAYYSAAVSGEITTVYIRENSRATVSRVFVEDWIFLHRAEHIMQMPEISAEKKLYLQRLLEQRKLSYVRHLILTGDKKLARKRLHQLDKQLLKPKKYIETIVALWIPKSLTAKVIGMRDAKYYRS